jgi:predicted transcriptional regulator
MLSGYKFLSENRDYFLNHSLKDLPPKLVTGIGVLEKCEPVNHLMETFANVEKIIEEAEDFFIYMTVEPLALASGYQLALNALNRGVKIRTIEPIGYTRPEKLTEYIDKEILESLQAHTRKGTQQHRHLEKINVSIAMSEKEVAGLNFVNQSGDYDYIGFTSENPQVVEWCMDVFDYYWERAKSPHEF